ncbi:hypothetical protein XSR1_10108 [Xenorhabdus szentirmaii DSM 16338]|uniref:Uncharacterized protein n=1 Tax=Xenorhabdus szentirmaii DSM 16338 TaxID=1427518 RepID=W1IS15_9GAMM|nr:hypothetical protein XSR1_10108 [Xenorhabdus szentirmaii DSM 16338]
MKFDVYQINNLISKAAPLNDAVFVFVNWQKVAGIMHKTIYMINMIPESFLRYAINGVVLFRMSYSEVWRCV